MPALGSRREPARPAWFAQRSRASTRDDGIARTGTAAGPTRTSATVHTSARSNASEATARRRRSRRSTRFDSSNRAWLWDKQSGALGSARRRRTLSDLNRVTYRHLQKEWPSAPRTSVFRFSTMRVVLSTTKCGIVVSAPIVRCRADRRYVKILTRSDA